MTREIGCLHDLIDYLAEDGGVLTLPPGTYRISPTLDFGQLQVRGAISDVKPRQLIGCAGVQSRWQENCP